MGLALCFEGFRAKNNAETVLGELYKKKNRNEVDQKINNLVVFAADNGDQLIPIARNLHQKIQTFFKTNDETDILISCSALEELIKRCSESLPLIIQSIKKVILLLMEENNLIYKIKGVELILRVAERSGNDAVVFLHEIENLIPMVIDNMTTVIDEKDVQNCYKLRAISLKCIEMMTAERWNTSKYIESIVEAVLKNMDPKLSASAQDAANWGAEQNKVFSSDIPRRFPQDESGSSSGRRARRTIAFVYQTNNPFLINSTQKLSDPNLVLSFGNIKTLAMECFSKLILSSTYIPLRNMIRTTMRFMIQTEQYKDQERLIEIFSVFINIFIRAQKNSVVFLCQEITNFIKDLSNESNTKTKEIINGEPFRSNLSALYDLMIRHSNRDSQVSIKALKKSLGYKEEQSHSQTQSAASASTDVEASEPKPTLENTETDGKPTTPTGDSADTKKSEESAKKSPFDQLTKKPSMSSLSLTDLSSLMTNRKKKESEEKASQEGAAPDQWFFQMFAKDPTEDEPSATLSIPTEPETESQKLSEAIDEKMNLPSIGEIILEKYEKDMAALDMILDVIPKEQEDEENDFLENDEAELEEIVLNEMNKPEFTLPSLFIAEQF